MRNLAQIWPVLLLSCIAFSTVQADPIAPPGDTRLKHDLQLLNDSGVTNIPLTAWPIALGDVHVALSEVDVKSLKPPTLIVYNRVREHLKFERGWRSG